MSHNNTILLDFFDSLFFCDSYKLSDQLWRIKSLAK